MTTAEHLAEAEGEQYGQQATATASDCPFGFSEPELRDAWFRGFSKGRVRTAYPGEASMPVSLHERRALREALGQRLLMGDTPVELGHPSQDMLDPVTIRACATLARKRADSARRDPKIEGDRRDGLERLGAARALDQLAKDLEVTADHEEQQGNGKGRQGD